MSAIATDASHAGFRPRQLGPVKAKFLADAACNARIKDLARSAERNFRLPPFVMDYHHDWALPSHARLAFRPDDRGLSLGYCTALSAAGPGQIVWCGIPPSRSSDGNRGSDHCPAITLAEPLRRASHWFDPP
jgi:hypothetical protein